MSDATDKAGHARPDPEGPGASLRQAREARGMGIKDIAQDLHLDPWIIEALEADDFEALGAPVFAKGHLRQYGGLLGLATDDLMIAYYRVRGRHDAPPPPITATMTRPETNRKAVWGAVALAILVLGALVALLWFLSDGEGDNAARAPRARPAAAAAEAVGTQSPPADRTDAVPGAGADERPESDIAPEVVDLPAEADDDGPPAAEPEPAPGTASVTGPGSEPAPAGDEPVTLQLVFNGESWVEVYDRDGARLIYGMYSAGRSRAVSAMPPIEVYLGRSRDVSVALNGSAYPIPAQSIRGNTARFVIEPDAR